MAESRQGSVLRHLVALVVVLALIALLGRSMVWVIPQNQQGVVLTFGEATRTVPPGIHFTLPWPCETVRTVTTTDVRTMPVGFKFVDRAQNLPPSAEEVEWLTGDTNIVNLQATVLYTIKDPIDYLYGIRDVDGEDEDSRVFAIRKVTEAALSPLIARMPIDEVLSTGKTFLQTRARDLVQETLDRLGAGIQVTAVNIIEVSAPPRVIGAFNDVSSARADRERMVNEAQGYAMRIRPRSRATANKARRSAESYRNGVLNRAKGAASSFVKLEEEARKNPELFKSRTWLDTMERVLARMETIVVQPSGTGGRTRIVLPADE